MKKVSKVFVVVLAMILTLAMGISAFAADGLPAVKKFGKVTYAKTMYTNGTENGTYDITFAYQYTTAEAPKMLVTSSDRSILRITNIENDTTKCLVTVTVQAVKNGKATITVADQRNTKKAKKVKITVKTLQDTVAFGSNVVATGVNANGVPTYEITVDAKGKAALGTSLANASKTKVTYEAVGSAKTIATITSKGAVTAKKAGEAVYNVRAKDVKNGRVLAQVTVKVPTTAVSSGKPVLDVKKLDLKSNLAADNHTYTLKVSNYAKLSDLVFTSNKPAVATVDANGTITGKANGKATITVASKTNSKLSAKVTVKVTTDVDVVTTAFKTASIVADGKSTLSILGSANKGASNAKVTYQLGLDGNNAVKKITGVSVSSKGIVKVKKTCSVDKFYVTVISKADKSYSQTVTINVIPSEKATAVVVKTDKNVAAQKKETITIKDNEPTVVTFTAEAVGAKNDGIVWTNSKPVVADIKTADNGKTLIITAKSVGTTKLTATAADGSKKKQVITLNVTKEIKSAGEVQVYAKEKVTLPAGTWKVADKKIAKISKGNVLTGNKVGSTTVTNGKETYTVYVGPKAADVQKNINTVITNTIKAENRDWMGISPAFNAKTNALDITVLNPNVDVKELRYTGASSYLPYFMTEVVKNDYNPKAVTVELGNGVVMKAAATYDTFETSAYDPATGKTATVSAVKTSDTTLVVKENETAYPAVTEWIVSGIDFSAIEKKLATKDLDVIADMFANAADYVDGVSVAKANDEPYTYEKVGDKLVVKHGAEVIFEEVITDGTVDRAKEAIKKDASVSVSIDSEIDTDTTLRAWIGQTAKITFTMQVKNVDYTFTYDVKSTMKASDYDSLVDADIQTLIDIAKDAEVDTITGIETIAYDAAKNSFEVVADADLDVTTAYDAIMKKVDAVVAAVNDTELTRTFDELQKVTASVSVPQKGQDNYEKVKADKSIEEFIKEFADTYYGIVSGKVASYAEMDGTVSGFYATFNIGNTSYTQYYEVRFVMTSGALKQAYDKVIDAKIASAVDEASKDAALANVGTVNYDAAANTFVATFNTDGTLESYKDSAIFATLKKAVLAAVSKESVTGAKLVVGSASLDIKPASAESMAQEVYAFLAKDSSKVSDLAKKDITFTVNFVNSDKEAYDLTYPIEVAVKDAAKAADVEAVEDVDTEADVTEEVETIDDVIEEVIDTPEVDAEEVAETEEAVTEDVEEVFEEELIEEAE